MKPVLTAFKNSPDDGQGQARDMRVRWALEELDIDYDVRLLTFDELKAPAHRAIHPFGKIPTLEIGGQAFFESGAIVLHLAEQNVGLLPTGKAREQAIVWLFAALNTVEPPIVEREAFLLLERDKPWFDARLSMLDDNARHYLGDLSTFLGTNDWLDGDFTIGDLMMVAVLRRLEYGPDILTEFPNLHAYVKRGEARPAFKRAYQAQNDVFAAQSD